MTGKKTVFFVDYLMAQQKSRYKLHENYAMTSEERNELGGQILDSCIEVHRILGPSLLESVYANALKKEFELREIEAKSYVSVPLVYKGFETDKAFQLDILVQDEIIIEIKAVEFMLPVFTSQLVSYLKLTGKPLGYLVNFNEVLLKNGFKALC